MTEAHHPPDGAGSSTSGDALIAIIRARIEVTGWSETARRCGMHRCHLHHTFGANRRGNSLPTLRTLIALLPAIGLELTVREIDTCSR